MRNRLLLPLALCAVLPLGGWGAESASWRFDFGWNEITPPKGFLKVTNSDEYTPEKGWGLIENRFSQEGGALGRFPYTPNAGHKHLDPLSRDGIRLDGAFSVAVPNGDYLVWYLEGDLGAYALQPMWEHIAYGLVIAGKQVHAPVPWDKERLRKEYFRWIDDEYRRGEDVYEKFIVPLMDDMTVAVTVTNGQMRFEGSGANLCAVLIQPAAKKTEFDAEVERLRAQRREFFYNVVKVEEPAFDGAAAPVTEEDERRGYQIWTRHKMREVLPSTQPEADELSTPLRALLAQGQQETVSFAVRPLEDLKTATVTVSDLVSTNGSRIAKESIRVRVLQYRVEHSGKVVRSHLPPFRGADLAKEITKQFWLTFGVPADAKPGVYAGQVTFAAAGKPATTLDFKVKVLDWTLKDTSRDAQFVLQSSFPARYTYQMAAQFPGEYLPAMRDVYQHLKSVQLLPQLSDIEARTLDVGKPTQRVEYDAKSREQFIALVDQYQKDFPGVPAIIAMHGMVFGRWTPTNWKDGWPRSEQPEHHWAAMKEYLEGYNALRKAHPDWPEFYFVIGAEMTNGGQDHVLYGKKCIELARSIPGLKIITCPNGLYEARQYAPLVDVLAANYVVPPTDEAFRGIPNEKTKLWLYQSFNRFCLGFYMARTGATGSFKEFYCVANQRPYNSFDGVDLWVNCALSSPDGMISMPVIEEMDWGVTDYRYVKTLEEWIAKARASKKKEAIEAGKVAEQFLATIFDEINPDLNYYISQAGWWDAAAYDLYRGRIAEHIHKIKEAL